MTMEKTFSHTIKGSQLGIILVLFILLFIVTQTFSKLLYKRSGSSTIHATQTFRVINESDNLRLQMRENSGFIEAPPSNSWLEPDGGKDLFLQDISQGFSKCWYQIYDRGEVDGLIQFLMITHLIGDIPYCYFSNIEWTNNDIAFYQINIGDSKGEFPTLIITDRTDSTRRGRFR
ncbi:hypothetical protein M3223_06440 [Paenibacillus pasadenensis]|uniref:hypothetical protein n=1 Tax=Paenibacillus pasadenensis TaxID=217090 RepID=UPI00203CDEFB|nr:hypothetical protein [Paenibacillus pasadenensis]MCM3746991.1 hypothetical protein [Paenibacillus pasadenensis]